MTEREEAVRSGERLLVESARSSGRRSRLLWLVAGPGILAMLGENDGPSMLSYAASGAAYGLGFFVPFTVALFAMAYLCQEMTVRVAAATGRGYGELVFGRYGRGWGWFGAVDLALTNLATLVAEFVSIQIGLSFFGLGAWAAAVLGIAMVIMANVLGRYSRWERLVLGLAAFNALFLVTAVLVHPDPAQVGRALLTWSPAPGGSPVRILLLLTSVIGATVTPWMVFFQQSASADKGLTRADLGYARAETGIGAALAALFGVGALITGAALAGTGSGADGSALPAALGSVAGHPVAALFAIGLAEAGAVALLTISASTGYALAETMGRPHSFNSSPRRAAAFHGISFATVALAAAVILIPGVPLLSIALNANVLATVLLPATLVFLLMLANDRELMGASANKPITNVVAVAVIVFVAACSTAYAIAAFLQTLHALPA